MGWTNSVPIFHNNITFILQPEILYNVLSFINNVGAKGPEDWKIDNSKPAKHPANPNICLVLWEFFELLNRILQQMKYCSGTFLGHKLVLCTPTFKILGHVCIPSIDTSYIAVSYYFCQCTSDNCKECHYNCFGLIMLNDREARFSQPKLELYYLIGVRNLIIKVDTCYIKDMLQNPDIQPFTSMNQWIIAILMFHFKLVHIKETFHAPNGLSQCLPQPGNPPVDDSNNSIYNDWSTTLSNFIDGDQSRWSTTTYSVFWSECVTVCKQMGCSPYYATMGTHPLLPANIVEATYLQPPPNSLLSTIDYIVH
ncbi:hypothetical protein J132_04060 [Termitomyces sp. J132]|nr:hypothetical protein J132_04060 [Termitomyces sp. J132]